jgi:hypothetical protein
MSIPFSFEQLARIRDDIRRLAARAADHQHELEAVVRAAEADVREAEAARSHALVGVEVTADELQRLPAGRRRLAETLDSRRRSRGRSERRPRIGRHRFMTMRRRRVCCGCRLTATWSHPDARPALSASDSLRCVRTEAEKAGSRLVRMRRGHSGTFRTTRSMTRRARG